MRADPIGHAKLANLVPPGFTRRLPQRRGSGIAQVRIIDEPGERLRAQEAAMFRSDKYGSCPCKLGEITVA